MGSESSPFQFSLTQWLSTMGGAFEGYPAARSLVLFYADPLPQLLARPADFFCLPCLLIGHPPHCHHSAVGSAHIALLDRNVTASLVELRIDATRGGSATVNLFAVPDPVTFPGVFIRVEEAQCSTRTMLVLVSVWRFLARPCVPLVNLALYTGLLMAGGVCAAAGGRWLRCGP